MAVCASPAKSWRSVGSFSQIYWPAIAVIVAVEQVHCTGGRMVVYNIGWLGIGEHMGRVSYHSALCACGVHRWQNGSVQHWLVGYW